MTENKRFTIKQMSEDDRPREKLLKRGVGALSDSELLAIMIGSGWGELTAIDLAKKILNRYSNNLHQLGKATLNDLMMFKGIGEARAINILAALEFSNRRAASKVLESKSIRSSSDAYEYLRLQMSNLDKEVFRVLYLKNNCELLLDEVVSIGGMTATVVDVRVILRKALELNAVNILVAHNHPSGNCTPSSHDISITKQLADACRTLNIGLLDHIIVTGTTYYSFIDNGKL